MLSFGFGYRNYSEAKQHIVSDLNRALRQTVLKNRDLWLNADTIRAYSELQNAMGDFIAVSSPSEDFKEALSITELRKVAGLSLHILKKGAPTALSSNIPGGYLASDTLVWASTNVEGSGVALSFRGYARCSTGLILSLSKQSIPGSLLLATLLWGGFSLFYLRKKKKTISNNERKNQTIHFGSLSLALEEGCFYNGNKERFKLTPMQYTLMEMFYLSPSHVLLKSDICQSLWPGKDNADETLYTLIRRLKPIIEEHANLKINTERGRAYILELA